MYTPLPYTLQLPPPSGWVSEERNGRNFCHHCTVLTALPAPVAKSRGIEIDTSPVLEEEYAQAPPLCHFP